MFAMAHVFVKQYRACPYSQVVAQCSLLSLSLSRSLSPAFTCRVFNLQSFSCRSQRSSQRSLPLSSSLLQSAAFVVSHSPPHTSHLLSLSSLRFCSNRNQNELRFLLLAPGPDAFGRLSSLWPRSVEPVRSIQPGRTVVSVRRTSPAQWAISDRRTLSDRRTNSLLWTDSLQWTDHL